MMGIVPNLSECTRKNIALNTDLLIEKDNVAKFIILLLEHKILFL